MMEIEKGIASGIARALGQLQALDSIPSATERL
jgi:hypothetical protein